MQGVESCSHRSPATDAGARACGHPGPHSPPHLPCTKAVPARQMPDSPSVHTRPAAFMVSYASCSSRAASAAASPLRTREASAASEAWQGG